MMLFMNLALVQIIRTQNVKHADTQMRMQGDCLTMRRSTMLGNVYVVKSLSRIAPSIPTKYSAHLFLCRSFFVTWSIAIFQPTTTAPSGDTEKDTRFPSLVRLVPNFLTTKRSLRNILVVIIRRPFRVHFVTRDLQPPATGPDMSSMPTQVVLSSR